MGLLGAFRAFRAFRAFGAFKAGFQGFVGLFGGFLWGFSGLPFDIPAEDTDDFSNQQRLYELLRQAYFTEARARREISGFRGVLRGFMGV